ncbi:AIG2-like protein C-like isoform X1 [Glycine max]|uniref:AIG2-like protein C-like isoform X1 n=1 Tax=Glycine max TaxID=3847 RepID=UPI0007191519|nr:uncharacterized protein LOC100527521 isoform X1 [Glycine max]|eukprot:XP_014631621.1 uncharacterized protein LOC100527521 isoform X1 [Glycine max]
MSVKVNCVGGDTHNVFVYGSLLADEVVHTLLKRVPPTAPAILHDYHRFKIKGRVYPAILPVQNNKVYGRVLLGISGVELDILDEFEDVEYTRTDVEVSLKEWKQVHMNDFVKMTDGFRQELELPESKPRVQTYETFYKQENDKPLEP